MTVEYRAVGWREGAAYREAVVPAEEVPAKVKALAAGDCWVSAAAVPNGATRGKAENITRLVELPIDLDVKSNGLPSVEAAMETSRTLADMLGVQPELVVWTGHGLQPRFTTDPDDDAWRDVTVIGPLVKRWGVLVASVAERYGGNIDGVFDLARMLRAPGTMNVKNPAEPRPCVALETHPPTMLTVDRLQEVLDEYDVPEPTPDGAGEVAMVSDPAGWEWPATSCAFARSILYAADSERPLPGSSRHGWLLGRMTRVAAMRRAGCLTEAEYEVLVLRYRDAFLATLSDSKFGERREPGPYEVVQALNHGLRTAASKPDGWAERVELGREEAPHTHNPKELDGPTGASLLTSPSSSGASSEMGDTYTDLTWLMTGQRPEVPTPTHMLRDDGAGIFYDAAVNYLFGDPDSGKSWLALAAVAEQLLDGGVAVYVDADHNGGDVIADRLIALGVGVEVIADPDRFRHYDPDDGAALLTVVRTVASTLPPGVVVFDSAGEVVSLMGLESNNNDELTHWNREVHIPLVRQKWCVLVIDHMTKGSDGEWPTGGLAKKRFTTGLMVKVEPARGRPIAPDHVGEAALRIRKDRAGQVKRLNAESAGHFVLDSTGEGTTWRVRPPDMGDFVPTYLMEKVSKYLEGQDEPVPQRSIKDAITGKNEAIQQAIGVLRQHGFIRSYKREGTTSVRPYRDGMPLGVSE